VSASLFGGMNRHLRWGQCEDQPSVSGIHGGKSENVSKEGAISLRVLAGDDYVGAKHDDLLRSLLAGFPSMRLTSGLSFIGSIMPSPQRGFS
jgi:hypothetical protein